MRDYAKVVPKFWTGETCKALRRKGPEGLVVALYLMSAPGSNMLGLYYQPILFMAHETGLGLEGVRKGLADCIESGFCSYDEDSEMVWVFEMAKYQIAEALKGSDNRCLGIQRDYDAVAANPFLGAFFDRYESAFHLSNRRGEERGSEGPPKPRAGTGTGTGTGTGKEPPHTPPTEVGGAKAGRKKREKITFAAFLDVCQEAGESAIPRTDPIFTFATDTGIPKDFLHLAWREFAARHRDSGRMQKDWRAHFRDAVRRNWFKLWWFPATGPCELTTAGVQLARERDAERAREQDQEQAA
ncbi:hypothetical protein PAERUG_E15_London_28_01_14_07912 [Pseudomonas aeruginosa]|nr:hypothetical protein PAERUG_E15_London_28_01_14_07912 [Pseudomonas aeruginosa]